MDAEFQKRLLATYRTEAREHLAAIERCFADAASAGSEQRQREILRQAFRDAHSLKGAARSINAGAVEGICHRMESILADVSTAKQAWNPAVAAAMDEALAFLTAWHASAADLLRAPTDEAHEIVGKLAKLAETPANLEQESRGRSVAVSVPAPPAPTSVTRSVVESPALPEGGETVRTPVKRLDALFTEAEQMLSLRMEGHEQSRRIRQLDRDLRLWREEWGRVEPDARALRSRIGAGAVSSGERDAELIARLLQFSSWNVEFIEGLHRDLKAIAQDQEVREARASARLDALLDQAKDLLMQPFAIALEGLAISTREAARREGKRVRFDVSGEAVEIDRRILEEMKSPFLHLVRNALSHGIETPEERVRSGKAEEGTVSFRVTSREDGKVEVRVEDDGAGVDLERVRREALRNGTLLPGQDNQLSKEQLLQLIFRPEFSTKAGAVTEMAGRGLGLYIVAEKCERLGGWISVSSETGRGSCFTMVLPVTQARMRAVLVRAGGQKFFLPVSHVECVLRRPVNEIRRGTAEPTLSILDHTVPLVALGSLLGLTAKERAGEHVIALVVGRVGHHIALAVEGILDEQEIVLKNFGPQLKRVRHFSGAAILGSGEVVPVLAVPDLLRSAAGGTVSASVFDEPSAPGTKEKKAILVVEDSMTARTLLKHIVEGAGYLVETARDGLEGLAKAQARRFDLILSDIEMPRLDGIELTRSLRAEAQFSAIPIVLLTARATVEDRERGLEAGANAYMIKTSFDESNLLDTISDLLIDD